MDFQFEERDGIEVKGKGLMKTYLVHQKHHPIAFEEEHEMTPTIIEPQTCHPPLLESNNMSTPLFEEHLENNDETLEYTIVQH